MTYVVITRQIFHYKEKRCRFNEKRSRYNEKRSRYNKKRCRFNEKRSRYYEKRCPFNEKSTPCITTLIDVEKILCLWQQCVTVDLYLKV